MRRAHSCTLACFRNNPFKNAGVIASALLRHLSGKEVPHDILYSPEFVFGDTFPRIDSVTAQMLSMPNSGLVALWYNLRSMLRHLLHIGLLRR